MFAKYLFRPFILSVLVMLITQTALAQGTPYVVAGDQSINARECPRLTCSILKSLTPGTQITVLEMVNGEVVFGSDQWARFEDGGVEMFVYSTLVEPAAENTEIVVEDQESSSGVDTRQWIRFEKLNFELLVPRGWVEISELANDEELLTALEDMYGEEGTKWITELNQACEDQLYDLVLVEFEGSGVLYVEHQKWSGTEVSVNFLKRVMEMRASFNPEADVISAEVVALSAGEGARVMMMFTNESGEVTGNISYGIIVGQEVYYLTLAVSGEYIEQYAVMFDAIVNSFVHNPSNT